MREDPTKKMEVVLRQAQIADPDLAENTVDIAKEDVLEPTQITDPLQMTELEKQDKDKDEDPAKESGGKATERATVDPKEVDGAFHTPPTTPIKQQITPLRLGSTPPSQRKVPRRHQHHEPVDVKTHQIRSFEYAGQSLSIARYSTVPDEEGLDPWNNFQSYINTDDDGKMTSPYSNEIARFHIWLQKNNGLN
jgi:hypothetical protein